MESPIRRTRTPYGVAETSIVRVQVRDIDAIDRRRGLTAPMMVRIRSPTI